MSGDDRSRRELAEFLRNRRARISPGQVGIPVGSRRRTSGLRREEVAVLAGLSPTWYTYLEQGRNIHPSPEVLDSLARVLQLSEDERGYMHILAYGHVVKPQPAEKPADELLRQIVDAVGSGPYPVYAANQYGELIAWNRAAAEWYDDWDRLPPADRNIVRWMVTSPRARERLLDWEDDTQDAIARWRAESAKWPSDERLRDLIAEFTRLSSDFARWWDGHEVREHRVRIRRFRLPQIGIRSVRLVPLGAPDTLPSGIVLHLPV
ncbi:helix-turn-helix transcriptional regulator [Allonocardiopsis opalescens]|uniref:Helix-turn-helix protein n=1 Tax=Allonocardiopsis opalescens TaxID=1144618 RepID=A0A2T0Q0A8_9ACTN|nr:helix-turn-helix transcriptional regulator [Allonocardiopsis opalescens]PRX97103.1 helix-turn-helix protein [Allonocardiopsis opalescens]